jgi:predicted dehydrogenase
MPVTDDAVRWAVLGTAHIAEASFLPALAETGDGVPYLAASRTARAARDWAVQHDMQAGVEGYTAALTDPLVHAVYVPLPNAMHAAWSAAALQAGKTVLCEKPLCVDVAETERLLTVARDTGGLLWESFVFPFHPQTETLKRLLADGVIGEVREVESHMHFTLRQPENIRWDARLGGGALNDVGCYPIRLARLVFGAEPETARADAVRAESGVDAETSGELLFPGERRLVFSCGFQSDRKLGTRIVGTDGEVRLSNPFHPRPGDALEVWRGGELVQAHPVSGGDHSFTPALRHIHDVLLRGVMPRHLAVDDALGNARALELVREAAGLTVH